MTEILTSDFLKKIKANQYSVISLSHFNNEVILVNSNISTKWRDDFIRNKLDTQSELVIKAKYKITPLQWDVNGIDNPVIKNMAVEYGIRKGITYTIRVRNEVILFTVYFQDSDIEFMTFYYKNKHRVFYDILNYFENNYKCISRYILTNRETEIMNCIKLGKTYAEAGFICGVTERTIRFHLNNVLKKLDVSTVKHAIAKSISEGLI